MLEFSGRMIVRPVQGPACVERGLTDDGARALRARADERVRPHLVEYIPATDEYVVSVLALHFGTAVLPSTAGDLSGDGLVDISDFNVLAGDFGCGA